MLSFAKFLFDSILWLIKFLIFFSAFFLIIILLPLIVLLVLMGSPPSDEKMIKRFNDHRTAFESIVELCQEDGIGYERGQLVNSVTEKRLQYQKLFRETRIVKDVSCSDDGSADLTAHISGVSISGHRKYYVYNPQQQDMHKYNVVPTLNENLRYNPESGEINAIRHITGRWYLAFYAYSDAQRVTYN